MLHISCFWPQQLLHHSRAIWERHFEVCQPLNSKRRHAYGEIEAIPLAWLYDCYRSPLCHALDSSRAFPCESSELCHQWFAVTVSVCT